MRASPSNAALLEPRVSWLRVDVHGQGVVNVRIDGKVAARDAEMPLDAGLHVVDAGAYRERVELKEGEHRVVSVDVQEPRPPPPPAPIIVQAPPPPLNKPPSGRFVFEPGIFGAYVQSSVAARIGAPNGHETVVNPATGMRTTCTEAGGCSYSGPDVPATASIGFQFFGGYSWRERVTVGIRLLVGPLFSGGLLFAVAPELSFRPVARFTLGAFLALGSWTTSARDEIRAPVGYVPAGEGAQSEERRGNGGAGLSFAFRVVELERGEILLTATPFFLGVSEDRVFAVPVGLAYRFR